MSDFGLSRVASARKQMRAKRRKPKRFIRLLKGFMLSLLLSMAGGGVFLFGTDTGTDFREWVAGTLLTTQHDYLAPLTLLPKSKLDELKQEIAEPVSVNSAPVAKASQESALAETETDTKKEEQSVKKQQKLVEIQAVDEDKGTYYFKGKLMTISDPNRVHLLITTKKGERGDLLDEFVKKSKAIGIVNASGFYDPDGMGGGNKANGLVIHDGKILQSYPKNGGDTALAISYDGRMITGKYSAQELIDMGVRDAMSFRPQLIVNGQNLFANQKGKSWGIQPRTAVGQKADGSIVFLVIDGRQPGHSIGASMKDVADILEQHGVVNAMAMDGGSSSMMLYNGEAITKTSCPYPRGRFLPNAWAVY